MQKSVTNWICLFFLGKAKPCAAHSELFVLRRTPIVHSLSTSLIGEGANVGLDMACHDTVWHWDQEVQDELVCKVTFPAIRKREWNVSLIYARGLVVVLG
jgi:hypothetical protein